MALRPGSRIGPYEITAQIGAGGMGEVYRATDTKLKRAVAIKVLPVSLAGDVDRLARFQREAEVLASLNHPNIASLYGLEEAADLKALVMELVDGPTLGDKIAQGALPLDEALPIARQIVEALEAAHGQGIIHRDLKPENIKVRPDGTVKVLDFGLAKAMDLVPLRASAGASPGGALSQSPTITTPAMTQAGVLLGTAAYMSPEQARGEPADKRSDIWAFGCVLYEMLTGQRLFRSGNVTETLALVLTRDPDWSVLPSGVPGVLRTLLGKCLARDPHQRVGDMAVARFALDQALDASARSQDPGSTPSRRHRHGIQGPAAIGVAVALALGASAVTWYASTRGASGASVDKEIRVEITTPPITDATALAVSQDGSRIVFAAETTAAHTGLWLRELNSGVSRTLAGTEGAQDPFWSPDGRSIGFFADGKLKRIEADGSGLQMLADAPSSFGGSWGRDGMILFAPTQISPIQRVSAKGGRVENLTTLDTGHLGHLFPQVLPDNEHFLYVVTGSAETQGLYSAKVDSSGAQRIAGVESGAVFAPPDRLLFGRGGALWSHPFDMDTMQVRGDAARLSDGVAVETRVVPRAAVSASVTGSIVYRMASTGRNRQLVWRDRAGTELARVGAPSSIQQSPAFSPDQQQLAVTRVVDGNRDVWLLDLRRNVLSRFTFSPADDLSGYWSPDGTRVLFSSSRSGVLGIYQKAVSGGNEEPFLVTAQNHAVSEITSDGRLLLYLMADRTTLLDLWAVPMDKSQPSFPVVRSKGEDLNGHLTADGAWLAYQSNESGRHEVFVRSFSGSGGAVQVSGAGGTQPLWRRDGRELFYLDLDRRLMSVSVAGGPGSAAAAFGVPQPLFQTAIGGAGIAQREYNVDPNGQRFLVDEPVGQSAPPIAVILNWQPPVR